MTVRTDNARVGAGVQEHARSKVYVELTKPRITAMVLLTVAVGFVVGSVGPMSPVVLVNLLIGAGLSCSGAGALNQYLERQVDGYMDRTRFRPLPAHQVSPSAALLLGLALSIGGVAYLAATVNAITAALDGLTLTSYLFVYTPMKRLSPLSTLIGAVPGALPPLMGWAAARGDLGAGAFCLFAILFLWQIPHFLAIGEMYKSDYSKGGFPMLSVIDLGGGASGRQAVVYASVLIPASLLSSMLGLTGSTYFWWAVVLGAGYAGASLATVVAPNLKTYRRLLLVSVTYLPALLAAMVIDRLGS